MKEFRQSFIDHGYTLAKIHLVFALELSNHQEDVDLGLGTWFFPWVIVPPTDSQPATFFKYTWNIKFYILDKDMHQKLQLSNLSSHQRFVVNLPGRLRFCHPVIASHCHNTHQEKQMSSVNHVYSCISCFTRKDAIAALHKSATRESWKNGVRIGHLWSSVRSFSSNRKRKKARKNGDEERSISGKISLHKCRCMLSKLSLTQTDWATGYSNE